MAIQHKTADKRREMGAAAMRTYPNISRGWGLKIAKRACCWEYLIPPIAVGSRHQSRHAWMLIIWSECH